MLFILFRKTTLVVDNCNELQPVRELTRLKQQPSLNYCSRPTSCCIVQYLYSTYIRGHGLYFFVTEVVLESSKPL